ncbi:MAG TPA: hypothetical protein VE196_03875, partial [Pseudonocardiaceae bacterium]|nr:hypothetical protein [Pseudonocardiaceae bacterium]
PQLAQLRAELDEGAVHDRTGARLHTSYLPAKVRWLRDSAADVVARVARWLSIGEYVVHPEWATVWVPQCLGRRALPL